MISGQEAQAKFNEFREAQGSHDEVYTDGSKMNEKVGAAAVINRHFQNGETTCHSAILVCEIWIFRDRRTTIMAVDDYSSFCYQDISYQRFIIQDKQVLLSIDIW